MDMNIHAADIAMDIVLTFLLTYCGWSWRSDGKNPENV